MKTQQILKITLASIFAGIFSINSAYAGGNVSLFYGVKSLDEVEWDPVEEQEEIGIMLDFNAGGLPVNIAIDYLTSDDTGDYLGNTYKGETTELNIGVRKYLDENKAFVPYIGGGIAFIEGTFSGLGLSQTDDATGFWANAGINWMVSNQFHIGADLRVSSADITLFGVDADAGGTHVGVTAGVSF